MKVLHRIFGLCAAILIAACAREAPEPTSVTEFMENPRVLEATMLRCAQNRAESRYLAECVNARSAVNRLEAAAERTRREHLESQSERKRQALRRTQEAAAAARRRVLEDQRRREEEEYLGIFDSAPEGSPQPTGAEALPTSNDNAPSAIVAPPPQQSVPPLTDPPAQAPEQAPEQETDLGAVREELKRRREQTE